MLPSPGEAREVGGDRPPPALTQQVLPSPGEGVQRARPRSKGSPTLGALSSWVPVSLLPEPKLLNLPRGAAVGPAGV